MDIELRGQHVEITPAIHEYVERRLRTAMSRSERGWSARVRLVDLNGPRGGRDKRCRIQLLPRGGGVVHVEDTAEDLTTTIDRAVARMSRIVRDRRR